MHDFVLANKVKLKVDRLKTHRDGLSKFSDGEIIQSPWGVTFKIVVKNKKVVNALMLIVYRENFTNDFIEGLVRRMTLCEKNKDKDIKEVAQLLTWMVLVRKIILEAKHDILLRR